MHAHLLPLQGKISTKRGREGEKERMALARYCLGLIHTRVKNANFPADAGDRETKTQMMRVIDNSNREIDLHTIEGAGAVTVITHRREATEEIGMEGEGHMTAERVGEATTEGVIARSIEAVIGKSLTMISPDSSNKPKTSCAR
jgi:hypothetical protein